MRLIVYGPFLIICFVLIQTSLAESKNYKRLRDNEDNSVERSSKYMKEKSSKSKHRTAVDDDGEENYKIDKHRNRKLWEQDHDFTTENKYSKYTQKANRFDDHEDEPQYSTTKKKSYDGRKGKDSEGSGKTQFRKDNREEKKHSKLEKEHSAEKTKNKHTWNAKNDDNDEDSEEETVKFEEKIVRKTKKVIDDFGESEEEVPKKKFRKKIRVRVPDSPEDESDESDEDDSDRRRTCERKFKRGKDQKSCLAQESVNGDESEDGPVRPKKIKYSIKFAHEKERSVPSEDDNIMLKIHRGEKKKYKYQDDDDDDSSEENTFPKRVRYLDDDEE
ncbi:transcriptional regulator ATRX homolog [Anoplophora glabripennis]|uniref:transcriptional regulator ATRX homolog n=1 Tax=Anoplophora glabripennis TaxID=217634 RepID=UPI0008747158|nr:transcriptional regulator ATRX homolog [Anoplophora glabripennis]